MPGLDYDIPITPQTVFDIASITKQFVAASLTMLALEGKLSLDDDLEEIIPRRSPKGMVGARAGNAGIRSQSWRRHHRFRIELGLRAWHRIRDALA